MHENSLETENLASTLVESTLLIFQNPNKRKFGLQVLSLWVIVGFFSKGCFCAH